jgi:hypothetical protein
MSLFFFETSKETCNADAAIREALLLAETQDRRLSAVTDWALTQQQQAVMPCGSIQFCRSVNHSLITGHQRK